MTIIPEEIEKYKKYLKQAQIDALVKKQRDYNNEHADERVEAEQSVRAQNDQTRRLLQNRGLASAPGNIISGEEPRRMARTKAQFDEYNEKLRRAESGLLENAAISEANKTIAEQNAAAQAAARAAAERAVAERAAAVAAEQARKAKMQQEVQRVQYNHNAEKAERYANQLMEEQWEHDQRAGQAKQVMQQAAQKIKQSIENSNKAETERQMLQTWNPLKTPFYKEKGYEQYEDNVKTDQIKLDAAEAELKQLKATRAGLERGHVVVDGRTNERTVNLPDDLKAIYDEAGVKIVKLEGQIDTLKSDLEKNRSEMAKINQEWNVQEAFQLYGDLSDEDLNERIEEEEKKEQEAKKARQQSARQRTAAPAGTFGMTFAASGSKSYTSKSLAKMKIVKAYRDQRKREDTIEEAMKAASGTSVFVSKKYESPGIDNANGWDKHVIATNFLKSVQTGKYSIESEKETGSKYYKAVNDREIIDLFAHEASKMGSSLNKLTKHFVQNKDEEITVHFHDYALQMTPEEVNAFNYLYQRRGPEAADIFFEALLPVLDQRGAERISGDAREFANQYPVLSDLATVPLNILSGIYGPQHNIQNAIYGHETGKLEAYGLDAGNLVREHRQEDWTGEGQFAYGTAMSILDSTAAAFMSKAIPGLGGAALGGSAYNSELREALDRGLSYDKAQKTAIAAGALEMLFEELSIEKLFKVGEAGSIGELAGNILKQAGFEASEEMNTEIGNMVADIVINGDEAKLINQYNELRAQGYSEKDAFGRVALDATGEVLLAGAGGLVSGGLMGGAFGSIGYARGNSAKYAKIGSEIRSDQTRMNELMNYRFKDENAAKLQKETKLTDAELGRLSETMRIERGAESETVEVGKKLRETEGAVEALQRFEYDDADLQELSRKEKLNDKEISALYFGMQEQKLETIRQTLGVEGKKQLNTFEKITFGVDISRREAANLSNNRAGIKVFNKTYGTNSVTRDQVLTAANKEAARIRNTFGQPVSGAALSIAQDIRHGMETPRRNTQATPEPVKETVTSRMTDEQRRMAALPSETDKTGSFETERGKVSYAFKTENARFLTSQQKAGIAFAQAIANVTGANIHIVDTLEENGNYDRASNTLTVALNSSRGVMHTVSHELTHWLENTDPEAYKAFVSVLEEEINALDSYDLLPDDLQEWIDENRKDGEPLFDTFVRYERQKDASLSEEGARAEAVAEFCEPMLQNMDVQRRMASENLSTARKIRNYLKGIYENIQKLLDRKDPSSREARLIESGAMDVKRVADAWAKAVIEASRKQSRQNGEGKQKQARETKQNQFEYMKPFAEQLRDFMDKEHRKEVFGKDGLLIGSTPDLLQKLGLPKIPVAIDQKHVSYSLEGTYRGNEEHKKDHMIAISEFAKLPEKISDPIAIIADKDTNDILILVGMKNLFGKRIVVPFQIEGGIRFGGESLDVQRAKSVYGRSDAIDKLLTAIEEDSDENIQLFYLNKDKSQKVVSAADKYIGDTVPNGIVHRLTEKNSPVKIQIHNQTELNQFRRWFKNSKVVNDDGTPKIVYHGTSEDFTVFDRTKGRANMDIQGMFFSPRAEEAADYGDKVGRYYLSIRNPASQYAAIKALNRFKGQNNAGVKAREYLESLGYDGVASDEKYIAFRPEQIKSATDNVGTFDPENPDVRYQRRDEVPAPVFDDQDEREQVAKPKTDAESIDAALSARSFKPAFERLVARKKAETKEWRKRTELADGRSFREKDVKALAKTLLKTAVEGEQASVYENVKANMKTDALAERLTVLLPKTWNALHGEADGTETMNEIRSVLKEILKSVQGKDTSHEEELALLKENLPKTIYLSEGQYAEVVSAYGNVYSFAKKLKAALGDQSVIVRKAGGENRANLGENWSEIVGTVASEYVDISDEDQPIALLELAETMKTETISIYQNAELIENMADILVEKMLDQVVEIVPEKQNVTTEEAQREVMSELAERAAYFKKLIRESMEKEEKAFKAGRKEGKQDQRELYAKKKLSESLKKNLKKIGETANHPKISMFIPEELMKSVSTYMKQMQKYILDPEKSMDNEIALKLQRAYERMKYDSDGMILNEIDDQIKETIPKLEEIMNKKAFKDLTAEEMKIISNTMSAVTHALTTSNKLINRAKKVSIQEQGERMIDQMHEAKALPKAIGWYLTRSLSAERFARLVSNYREDSVLVEEMQHLNEGAIEKERIAMEANKLFEDFIREYGKEYQTWFGKKAKWIKLEGIEALNTTEPEPVYVTNAMKLSMIMHARNPQNMKHILKGQITVPDQKLYRAGKLEDAYTKGKRIIFSASDVINLEKNLTEAEKAYLRCAEKLFYEFCPNAINKTSLALYGFRKAEVQNYFPIRTDKNYVKTNFEGIVHNGSIENMGMLKERKDASNPIILEDITQAVRRQIENTALFAGMAIPIRNFNRVMNVSGQMYESSVKSALEEKIGSKGMQVIEKILSDLQQKPRISDMDQIVGKITSNIVRATLATNLSVTIKQAASYPTAAAVLSWKSLAKALAKGGKNGRVFSRADMDLIEHYTPLLYIRKQGMIDRDIADYTTNKTWADKLPFIMDWIRKVDVATVGRLWYASEYEVADLHPELVKGSDAYYMEVAKLFNEVVQKTQPNYTTLQRAHFLRSENAMIHAIFGMFKTQAMQNGGILIDAAGEFFATRSLDKNDPHRRAAAKQLGKAISSQLIQNIVFCSMTLLAKAAMQKMNPYRDDDDELTKESIAVRFAMDMLQSFAGSFFAGSELFDVIMTGVNKMTGKEITAVYDSSTLLTDTINDVEGAFGALGNLVRHTDSKGNLFTLREYWKQTDKIIKAASQLAGVPYGNIKNIVMGIVNHTEDLNTAIESGTVDWFRHSSPEMEKQKTANAYKEWTKSGNSGKTFFYYKRKVDETKGTDEKRVVLNDAEDLTADQKAALDRMLIYAGEAETRIKDGALQKLTADNEWEIVADYSSSGMLRMSLISDSAYQTTVNLISAGLQENDAITAVTTYRGMPTEDESGKTRNQRFREWLNDQPISSKQKIAIDNAMIGSKRMPDYSDKDLVRLFTSASESTYENTVKLKATAGLSTKDAISIVETYKKMPTEDPSRTSRNQRFREWLSEQKFTKEQKETIDREIIKGKTVPDYSDKAWVALYNAVDISVYEKAVTGYQETGLLPSTFSKFYEQYRAIDAKDENGETVSGLKKKRTVELLKSIGLTDEQYKWLYYSFLGYKK